MFCITRFSVKSRLHFASRTYVLVNFGTSENQMGVAVPCYYRGRGETIFLPLDLRVSKSWRPSCSRAKPKIISRGWTPPEAGSNKRLASFVGQVMILACWPWSQFT